MDIAQLAPALAGRYEIDREIGRGAMATVYMARDVRHHRKVALKVLDPTVTSMLGAERFEREIRITAGLTHPNIIPLLDSGAAGGLLFYVTPFAEGESLRSRLDREKTLPVRDALRIAREVADALDGAHRQGVLHRDIKPDNILEVSGHAVVADFGIARAADAAAQGSLTATGISLGTPAYMSPEQTAGDHTLDARADIYSLGCVLYEMLAGEAPFRATTMAALLAQHALQPVPSLRARRSDIPEVVDQLVQRALAKDPADRFESAAAMRTALEAAGATATGVRTSASTRRVSRHTPTILIAAGVLVAIGLSVWRPKSQGASTATVRLAILPMANLSADPNDRYFADGMTDELITAMSTLGGLRVIARSSVLAYVGTTKTARDIGRELGVGAVLESTCRKAGERLRITVRLVDAETQEPRWTEEYDRPMADVFEIQHDVALRVAQALKVKLVPAESRRVARRPTENLAAYDLYLRGNQLIENADIGPPRAIATDSAIVLYQRAIALDSNFALAHAMLGQSYIARMFNLEPGPVLRERASTEIGRAAALDSNLAIVYKARSDLAYSREGGWRIEDAIRDNLHALALEPNLSDAHWSLAALLFHVGILEPARRELLTALALDPQNRTAPPRIARVWWYGQQYDSALAAMARYGEFPDEHGLVLGYLGRAQEGLAYVDSVQRRGREATDMAAARAVLLARLGRRAESEAAIRQAIAVGESTSHFHHAAFSIASAYALMGRSDDALRWLERTASDGMPAYSLFANDPTLASLRTDPRFVKFLAAERERHERLTAIVAGGR